MKDCNKIIISDWGGVIESHDNNEYTAIKAIIDTVRKFGCKFSDTKIIDIFQTASQLYPTCISDNKNMIIDWFNEIKKNLKINCSYSEYKNAYYEYGKKIPYYKDVVEYIHSLKDKCNIGIFSSLVKLDEARINDQVELSKFDFIFLSYEIGYDKTDIRAYKFIEEQLHINCENILFIDDTKANIEKAKQRNWNTCHVHGYELDKIKNCTENFLKNTNKMYHP